MILNDKTLLEFSYSFEAARNHNMIYCNCDYCGLEFVRKKSNIIASKKRNIKDSCLNKLCIKLKTEDTNLEKYGVINPSKCDAVKEKMAATNMIKYGAKCPSKNQKIKEKIAATNMEKYGNKCSLHSEETKLKTISTWKKNHNCNHPFASKEIRNKIYAVMDEKYGKHFTKTELYKNKTKETCLKKYGTEHSSQSDVVKYKKKKTNLEKYGCEYPSQNEKILNKIFAGGKQRKNYGKTQNEIKTFIEMVSNLQFNSKLIDRKEIDILNLDIKLGFEYCGLFWHNELSPEPRDSSYHYNKYILCKNLGIRLITIFEDEWIKRNVQCKNYIRSIIGNFTNRVYARKCLINEINNKIANDFYDKNHLQGKSNNIKTTFSLTYNEKTLGMISLGTHHRNSNKITITRLCFENGIQIIGGASRLLSAAIRWCTENNFNEIITWSDNRWSDGSIYEKIGFKLDKELKPDYSYVSLNKKATRLSKQSQKKSNTDCPENMTELEFATKNNLARIWDCGKKRWKIDF